MVSDRIEERQISLTVIDFDIRHHILHIVPLVEVVVYEVAEHERVDIPVLSALNACVDGSLHIRNTFRAESLDMPVILALRVTDDDKGQFVLNTVHRRESEVIAV